MEKVLFQYNNVDKPQLIIKHINNENVSVLGLLKFNETELNDDLPIMDEIVVALDQFLTRKNIKRDEALFVINAKDNFKLTTVLPNISDRKIKKIYEVELAQKITNIDDYDCLSVASESSENKIFYEYLINVKYRKFFEKVGESLSFNSVSIDYMNSYLFEEVTSNIKDETFAYIYEENKMSYLLVIVNGELCGYSSFESKDSNYRLNVSSIVDKHMFELEKADINKLYTNKEIPCLKILNPIVNKYVVGGKFDE